MPLPPVRNGSEAKIEIPFIQRNPLQIKNNLVTTIQKTIVKEEKPYSNPKKNYSDLSLLEKMGRGTLKVKDQRRIIYAYEGEFMQGLFHGMGKLTLNHYRENRLWRKTIYEGFFIKNLPEGRGVMTTQGFDETKKVISERTIEDFFEHGRPVNFTLAELYSSGPIH